MAEVDEDTMVDRICISINNRCNLACKYCHFHEKKSSIDVQNMDVFKILDNVIDSIEKNGFDDKYIIIVKRVVICTRRIEKK